MITTYPTNHAAPAPCRTIAARLGAWLLAGALLLPVGVHAAGVTLITHGWNPSGSAPAWMASLRDAIATNFLAGAQNYGTITVTGTAGSLTVTCNPWNVDLSGGTNSDILILLDWSAVADHLTGGPTAQAVAAAVIDKLVTGQNGQHPLAELPIHLIGHSRGGGLVCELARLLGERGIVVDQLTPLDPHPLTASDPQPPFPLSPVIDTPAAIYQNVVFADVYSQTNAYPMGEYLAGGYNRLWGALTGGYNNNAAPNNVYANHRNMLLLYQGTVNLATPFSNGEATLGATERAAWYNAYEEAGTNTGFVYSRLDGAGAWTSASTPVAGGDAIRAGLNSASVFGGGGSRSALTWSLAAWPNVAALDVLSNGAALGPGTCSVTVGTSLQLRYTYLDYSNGCTITFHVDADRNPYNGNEVMVLSTQVVASATGGSYTQGTVNWDTSAMTAGTTACVYAQVTDGTHTRYFCAVPILRFAAPPPLAPLEVKEVTLLEDGRIRLRWTDLGAGQRYVVEARSSFGAGAWEPAPPAEPWPISTNEWTTPIPPDQPAQFYRVRALPSGTTCVYGVETPADSRFPTRTSPSASVPMRERPGPVRLAGSTSPAELRLRMTSRILVNRPFAARGGKLGAIIPHWCWDER